MKNPHLSQIQPKRLKRKAREPMKRAGDERLPYFKPYKNAAETRDDGALDMRINARLEPVSGRSAPAQGFLLEPPRAASQAPDSPRERAEEPPRAIQQTRRLLANARERTRVHTISAAFEALRKQVAYAHAQHELKIKCIALFDCKCL